MQQQKIFLICLVLLGVVSAGYFSIRGGNALFDFFTFKASAQAQMARWEITETKGKFPLKGYYFFEAKGRIWHGSTRLAEPWHLNEASAVLALQERAKQNWVVWFNPEDPSKSSLEKGFPSGLVVRALVCYGVLAYFYWLARRISHSRVL